tara:strand:+ start:1940 stop:2293 length:354 start_codon:yes stop_codon:yes gene_type:complete
MEKDKLLNFNNLAYCPTCGCIDQKGSYRCLECGTFHSGAHLVEREAPPPEEQIEAEIVDPSAYSIGPKGEIIEESFEQSDSVVQWSGGSTDFTVGDDGSSMSSVQSNNSQVPEPDEL